MLNDIFKEIEAELDRAVTKFPTWPTDPLHAASVVEEEAGELIKSVLEYTYEPHKTSMEEIRSEAIQTAAMAIRFLMSLHIYEFKPSEQHLQDIKK
jgi:NTP pyrophosphatase (non-canonical NTP hydrolase)